MTGDNVQRIDSTPVDVGGHIGRLHLLNDAVGPHELRISPNGTWFHGGVEIVRRDIVRLFSANLRRSQNGLYYILLGEDEAPVVVEEAPFVVLRVITDSNEALWLMLNDDSIEPLAPETLRFKAGNVPYCLVRENLEAKFSRQAYYQLAKYIDYSEKNKCYYLHIGGTNKKLEI
jgi:hypothetical protein